MKFILVYVLAGSVVVFGASIQERLFSAIAAQDPAAVSIAVNGGADPNSTDARGRSALLVAHDDTRSVDVFVHLLRGGADPNAPASRPGNCILASLLGPDSLPFLKAFIEFGGDINAPLRSAAGVPETYLLKAVFLGQVELVRFVIKEGARTDVRDWKNRTLLQVAIDADRYQVAYTLLRLNAITPEDDLASDGFPQLMASAPETMHPRFKYWREKLVQELNARRARRP
jgi:ankyrin repeat protein